MKDNIFFKKSDLKHCGKNVIIGKTVRIRHPELVEIGDNCIIDDFTIISGKVELGNYVHIGSSCSLQAGNAGISKPWTLIQQNPDFECRRLHK